MNRSQPRNGTGDGIGTHTDRGDETLRPRLTRSRSQSEARTRGGRLENDARRPEEEEPARRPGAAGGAVAAVTAPNGTQRETSVVGAVISGATSNGLIGLLAGEERTGKKSI